MRQTFTDNSKEPWLQGEPVLTATVFVALAMMAALMTFFAPALMSQMKGDAGADYPLAISDFLAARE